MRDEEWGTTTDVDLMLRTLSQSFRGSERKLRLFGCACVRQVLPLAELLPEQTRAALAEVEQYADGGTTKAAMKRVRERLARARASTPSNPRTTADDFVCFAVERVSQPNSYLRAVPHSATLLVGGFWDGLVYAPPQADLARCIFGNPFRPVDVDPAWRTSTVATIARQMYDSRDFSPMPILADALQDAGCDSADVLEHCRGPGPHVCGCWVVDLVLGKG
jgi:hypothetical protein